MILIESDLLRAALSREDKHNTEAVSILDKFENKLVLSPYSVVEIDLILKAGVIKVSDYEAFHKMLESVLEYRGIKILAPKPIYHAKAYEFREKYGLTYFDSLHASICALEGFELVSFDRVYESVVEVKYKHPSQLIS